LRGILNVTQRQRQWGGKVIALFYHCSVCRSRSHYLSVCPTGRSKRLAAFQSAIKTFPSIWTNDRANFTTWKRRRYPVLLINPHSYAGPKVQFGSTAVHPVSSGNRQQWVESPDSFWTIVTIAAWLHGEVNVDFHRCDRGNAQGTESLQTPRWREVDSNSRSRWRTLQSKDISGSVRVYDSASVLVER
jgi:hypothetical protein